MKRFEESIELPTRQFVFMYGWHALSTSPLSEGEA